MFHQGKAREYPFGTEHTQVVHRDVDGFLNGGLSIMFADYPTGAAVRPERMILGAMHTVKKNAGCSQSHDAVEKRIPTCIVFRCLKVSHRC